MPRFAANLSMMFTELPFLERFGAAANEGFQGVEYLFPYEFPAEAIQAELAKYGLESTLFNLPPGDWSAGERGTTCLPGREEEFRAGVATALQYAGQLNTTRLHAMAGVVPAGVSREDARATYVANMKFTADALAAHGIMLLMESINTRDIPGFFLNTQAQAFEILQEIGASNVMLQMDLYHMQIMEGDLVSTLSKYASHCGHVQLASVPKRNEPDTGEVYYPYLYDHLDAIGYKCWIGCEYRPAGKTVDGLGWFRKLSSR